MSWYNVKSFTAFFVTALIICGLIILNYFDSAFEAFMPNAPAYFVPVFSIGTILLIFFFLWQSDLEDEMSKHEFITIITHKFRTPLTGIKWAIETLRNDITTQQKEDILVQHP